MTKCDETYSESATHSDESRFWAMLGAGNKLSSVSPFPEWDTASMETIAVFNENTQKWDATCTITYRKNPRRSKWTKKHEESKSNRIGQ